jgi:long-chain acyl-CoA synthetase
LVRECVEKVNAELAAEPDSPIRKSTAFSSCTRSLTADDDELTDARQGPAFVPSANSTPALIDALYGGKTAEHIETLVKFEDGRSGLVAADLAMRREDLLGASQTAA